VKGILLSEQRYEYISLFSGAMGFDLGLEEAGLRAAVCLEIDPHACDTIRHNRPHLPVIQQDITKVSTEEILKAAGLAKGEAFAVIGGPPCQSFSTGGLRQSIVDRRGSLFADFVRVIDEAKPLYFVFENVAQILTAAVKHRPISERPGQRWHLSSYKDQNTQTTDGVESLTDDEQAGSALNVMLEAFDSLGYSLSFAVLNSADYGVAQRRFRFVMIGSRIQRAVELPKPSHSSDPENGLPAWQTLRTALRGLKEENPLHSNYTPAFKRYFELVKPGGNWRDLPPELQREALGNAYASGGGKTGFFRRLSWEEATPTIVGKSNRKSSALCHPSETRPLTVREAARIQGFPDYWELQGGMNTQFLQVGNAVPVQLGVAVGQALKDAYRRYLDLENPEEELLHLKDWHFKKAEMLEAAGTVMKQAARNKRGKKKPMQQDLVSLFE
jgi:DNA (cytosine-5)-methyltransferase 1